MNNTLFFKETWKCLLFILLFACEAKKDTAKLERVPLEILENSYKQELQNCIYTLKVLATTKNRKSLNENYLKARNSFKKIEPILSFVDKENYKALNQPNFLKVEEEDLTNIKSLKAFGFQVIEESLAESNIDYEELTKNINKTRNRLKLIYENSKLQLKDYHILWLVRDAILRVSLVSNTGFDSPVLQNSLLESSIVYEELRSILKLYANNFKNEGLLSEWNKSIELSLVALNAEFETFDRYSFIKNHTHKQLQLWVRTQQDWGVEFPFSLAINNDATGLFSESTFNKNFFTRYKKSLAYSDEKSILGKKLFHDKRLSKNNEMSCATCHQADKGFADGLKTFPKQKRNTPTVLYAGLQKAFFHDNRSGKVSRGADHQRGRKPK